MIDLLLPWTLTVAEKRAVVQIDVDVSVVVRKLVDDPVVEIRSIWLDGLNLAVADNPVLRALGLYGLTALENDDAFTELATAKAGYSWSNPSGDPSFGKWRAA